MPHMLPFFRFAGIAAMAYFLPASAIAQAANSIPLVTPILASAAVPMPLSAADEKAVRSVIQAQLAAFAKGDATAAFSFAAPNIRAAMNSDADAFMAMVKKSYPVVYSPSAVVFLKPERQTALPGGAETVIQRVQMQDANGDAWLAVYGLERSATPGNKNDKGDKAGNWRINGCMLTQNKGRTA